jgi:hypothetical protein
VVCWLFGWIGGGSWVARQWSGGVSEVVQVQFSVALALLGGCPVVVWRWLGGDRNGGSVVLWGWVGSGPRVAQWLSRGGSMVV